MRPSQLGVLAVFLALMSLLAAPAHALDRERLARLSVSLVKVEATDEETHLSLGSGVVVAPERVLTNCHVTRSAEQIFVLQRGLRWRAAGQASDPEHDLCVLQVPGLGAPSAEIGAASDLHVGEAVWALGFEGGLRLQVRVGRVRALHAYDDGLVVESTTPFTSGASGGALFDQEGRLAAILTYRLRGDRTSHFSVPVEWALARVQTAQAYAPVMPLPAVTPFWQRADMQMPYFMRAHQLELGRDWAALLALTDDWAQHERFSAEPWVYRGRGLAHTADLSGARFAFEQALRLDPMSSNAWLELVRVSAHRGLLEDAQEALVQLENTSPEAARCLERELDLKSEATPDADVEDCSAL